MAKNKEPQLSKEEKDILDQIINDSKSKADKASNPNENLSAFYEGLKAVIKQAEISDTKKEFGEFFVELDVLVNQITNIFISASSTKSTSSAQYDSLLVTFTPASDVVLPGFAEHQLVFGRKGNDVLYPFNHSLSYQTPNHINLLLGDTEIVALFVLQSFLSILEGNPPSDGKDTFVLGDWKISYYNTSGYNDFAFIFDFDSTQDVIQLGGSAENYKFVTVPFLGTGIFENNDLTGIVFWNFDMDPKGANIRYVGNTSPAGPVQPKIKQLGTVGLDIATAVDTDISGNVYVTGLTNGSLQETTARAYDTWIAKYKSDGNQEWIQQLGTPKTDIAVTIATDKSGNFYVAGGTQGNLGGTLQATEQDAWLAKYDSNGNQVWIRQFGEAILNGASAIDIDDSGNVYVSGLTVTGDKRPVAIIDAQDDSWVRKYDSNGNLEWSTKIATPESYPSIWDETYGVAVALDGSVYATGWTYGGLAGDNANLGTYDAWISKLNNNGQIQWTKQFGSTDFDFSWDIDTDSKDNIYAYGWTKGNLGGTNAGGDDLYLAKYLPDGTQAWIRQFGTSGEDAAFFGGIEIDSNDNIFLTGYTDGSLGGSNAGSYDAWVTRYETNGSRVWIQQFGTPNLDYSTDVTVDNAGHLYVTGFTEGSLGGVNNGAVDSWVAKLDANSGTLLTFNPNVSA